MALKILPFLIFMFVAIKIMLTRANGFGLKLIPITSIDSVYFPKNLALEERHYRLVELSKARVLHLRSMTSASTINSTEAPMKPSLNMIRPSVGLALSSFYISKLFIGSRFYIPYLLVDSGGSTTWVQCDRCTDCFPLRGGNFRYYESTSFHTLPCEHQFCVPRICHDDVCHYNIKYPQSRTKGLLGRDSFTFPGINGTHQEIANIVFGCGLENQNISFGLNSGPNNVIAGIFGLARGPRSLLRQLSFLTKLRFSYCLQSWTSPNVTHTFLHFGDDAKIGGDPSRRVQGTRLLPNLNLYHVNMFGISVEGKRLLIDPRLFRRKPDNSGGFFIDSGSPHSLLVEPAYRILREEMVQYLLRHYGWHPWQREEDYDLCYHIPPRGNYSLPSITFHFEGADLFLDGTKVFNYDADRFCMYILSVPQTGLNLLGAFQQADHRFLFDVEAGRMFFVPEKCGQN